MRKIITLFSGLIFFICCGCKEKLNENSCLSYPIGHIVKAEGPTTRNVKEDISFIVTFALVNGCFSFFKFEESLAGNTISINAIAKNEGCLCNEIYGEVPKVYLFKRSQRGNFQLRFNTGNDSYIEKNIMIN